jgi:hypothetical protein
MPLCLVGGLATRPNLSIEDKTGAYSLTWKAVLKKK